MRKYGEERDIFLLENPYVSGACDLWAPLGVQVGLRIRTHRRAPTGVHTHCGGANLTWHVYLAQVKEHYVKATLTAVGKRKFVLASYSGGALYAMEMITQLTHMARPPAPLHLRRWGYH